jgi:hypothetical protein
MQPNTLRLLVGRRRSAPAAPSMNKVRPGEPLPRGKLYVCADTVLFPPTYPTYPTYPVNTPQHPFSSLPRPRRNRPRLFLVEQPTVESSRSRANHPNHPSTSPLRLHRIRFRPQLFSCLAELKPSHLPRHHDRHLSLGRRRDRSRSRMRLYPDEHPVGGARKGGG